MPKFTRPEFAKACGVTNGYIKNYVKRGKLVEDDDGGFTIDHEHPQNELFYEKRKGGSKLRAKPKAAPAPAPKANKSRYKKPEKQSSNLSESTQLTLDLDRKSKEAEYEKKLQDIEINKLKIAKLRGDVIPTDLVNMVFKQHFKSVTTSFHQGADGFISTVAKSAGIDKEEISALRGELVSIINRAVKDAISESKSSIKNIVGEYSQKRGVGEKK